MSILRVVTYGDERLKTQCEPVEALTPELQRLIADMGDTMYTASGVGLAAPQVGILKRFLVLDVDQMTENGRKEGRRRLQVFINPEILGSSEDDEPFTEGCLSIPGVEAEVYRPTGIRLRWRDAEWREHEEDIDGLLARVVQHEVDHLDGVLFVDRLSFVKRQAIAGQLRRLRKERDSIVVPAELAAG